MKIIVAKNAGFCFGVHRAVHTVYENLSSPGKIYTLGPIIHNPQVVEELRKKGVAIEENVENIHGDGTVIIRSHGVSEQVVMSIRSKNLRLIDATCPYVKRIHGLVQKHYQQGYTIIIIGEKDHPEVIGINGWCNNQGYILNNEEDAINLPTIKKACIVAQTTTDIAKWDNITGILTDKIINIKLHNTICYATSERQKEAEQIARTADIVYVIGGSNSSNTKKLYNICKRYCLNTFTIETVVDIDASIFSPNDIVGITAGASTPDWIIKEVLNKMNDINDELMEEQEQEQQQEAISQDKVLDIITDTPADEELTMDNFKIVSLKPGQIVKGTILRIDINELIVNVGYKSDGIVPNDEIILDSDQKLHDVFKEGDEIEVEVLMINDGDGNVLLSQKTIAKKLIWKEIEEIFKNQTEVAGIGMEIVKGGLIARVKGISAFVPASQLTTRYVEDLSTFVGQNLRLKILEIDKARSRIVASQKIVLEAADTERRQQVWENIQEGQKINGEVKRLTNFGAFVDIGGVDGLIHISDLAWGHINNPRQVVTEGQQIEVIVLSLDRDKNKIALGYKQTKPCPWDNIEEKYPVGQITKGKVVRIANFGAFVELEPGVDGLVHISEISDKRINKVEDVLKSGDIVSVKILDVKYKEQRISLSIREASVKEDTTMPQQEENTLEHEDMNVTLGEFFPDKLKDIE